MKVADGYGCNIYYDNGVIYMQKNNLLSVISYEKAKDEELLKFNSNVYMASTNSGMPEEMIFPGLIRISNGRHTYTYENFHYHIEDYVAESDKELPETYIIPQRVSLGKITMISKNAFYNSKRLKNIVLHDNITEIQRFAFEGCENLESCNLPDSVTNIENKVFNDTKIYKNEKNWREGMLIYNGWLLATKEEISGEIIIPSEVKGIAEDAFEKRNISKIIIPGSVRHYNEYAFDDSIIIQKV